MSEDLYFVPILAKALKSPNPKASLQDAFAHIKQLGSQKQYSEAFRQFELFMDEVCKQNELMESDVIRRLIVELATETFEGSPQEKQMALDKIKSYPQFKTEYEMFSREIDTVQAAFPVIQVFGKERLIGEMVFTESSKINSIGDISPGSYILKLNTGRVIWEGALTSADLIWAEAFPERDLQLAAETAEVKRKPARKIALWDGEIIIRTYAGIESGSIEVELTK